MKMKKSAVTALVIGAILLGLGAVTNSTSAAPELTSCPVPLKGKVRVVNDKADYLVRVRRDAGFTVTSADGQPAAGGDWQFVDHGEDFTIRFVDECPQVSVTMRTHDGIL